MIPLETLTTEGNFIHKFYEEIQKIRCLRKKQSASSQTPEW